MSIDKQGGVLGDMPCIAGTRIGVHHIEELVLHGQYSVEDVATEVYPHLSEEQVLDALEYIFTHQHEYHRRHRNRLKALQRGKDQAITSESDLPRDARE